MHQIALSVLDEEALSRLSQLDPTGKTRLVARVLEAFEASAARLAPQLRAARAAPDMGAILHVAHTLKSSSASIGATRMAALCVEVEAMARDARGDGLDDKVGALLDEIDAVRLAVREKAAR